jgi:putative membrane-bound dehydrogenase-like protein
MQIRASCSIAEGAGLNGDLRFIERPWDKNERVVQEKEWKFLAAMVQLDMWVDGVGVFDGPSMRQSFLFQGLAFAATIWLCSTLPALAADINPEWAPLFDGKSLNGWYIVLSGHEHDQDPDHLVQVHDKMIHMYADAPDKTEQSFGYVATQNTFSNYRLRLEYKWGKKQYIPRAQGLRDAGLLYHVHGKDSAQGVWPFCFECQIQEGNTGDLIPVGTRCTTYVDPATKDEKYPKYKDPTAGGVPFECKGYVYAGKVCDTLDGWNKVEIVVNGSESSEHIVNGEVNETATNLQQKDGDNWVPIKKGHIALQLEGAEVYYRNIEIKSLEPGSHQTATVPEADSQAAAAAPAPAEAAAFEPPPLEVPEGFEVTVAAAPPLVEHPMMACLDDRGRLFISESDGINREAQQLIKDHPHKILMLEDTDGDGVYDKRTVFADGLLLPNGAEWHDGSLYVCSAPYIWRFRDLDGDGHADEATKIIGTFNFDGRSSAFHGPQLGPDGRLYWCGGQHGWTLENPATATPRALANPQKLGYDSAYDGPWVNMTPGTFSCWPDGTDGENMAYGGICNPVEVAFTPEGEVIGTVSVYDYVDNTLRRDAVLHWIDGGVYNLMERKYAGLTRTGTDLTPLIYRGHSAPAGIMRYRGNQFGADYSDNFFFTEFNTHKVYRLMTERIGATFSGRDQVFLSSSDTDTHFTDVMEDADGSLLVVDTGGWFLYGCPTSQIAKPSIKGAIYRIRKKGQSVADDPRGTKLTWGKATNQDLIKWVGDSRFAVVDRATADLGMCGAAAVPAIERAFADDTPQQRLQSVWALTRMDDPSARAAVRKALRDQDFSVRLAATHSTAVRRDSQAVPQLIALLDDPSAAIRREAATALGRIRAHEAVPALFHAATQIGDDRFLDHAIILALIRIGDGQGTLAGLSDPTPAVRRVALVALDQMNSDELTRKMIGPLLNSGNAALEQAATRVLRNRPAWAGEISGRLTGWLTKASLSPQEDLELRSAIRAFWNNETVAKLVADALSSDSTSDSVRLTILESIEAADADKLPATWLIALENCLKRPQPEIVGATFAIITARNLDNFDALLEQQVAADGAPESLRLAAAIALSRHVARLPDAVFDLLMQLSHNSTESVDRLAAAHALATAKLSDSQRLTLVEAVADAGPLDLPSMLGAFDGATDPALGERLVASLSRSPGLSALSSARLAKLLDGYPTHVKELAKPLTDRLGAQSTEQANHLQELQDKMAGGDPKRGHDIFYGSRASCFACHRIGNVGGNIGPNLSNIGQIRTQRDLLEAVVYPSASFARGFEPYDVVTSSGKVFSGIMSRETPQAVYLRIADRSEIRIPHSEIEEIHPGTVSIMPQGFDKLLGDDQLRDLITFLMFQK